MGIVNSCRAAIIRTCGRRGGARPFMEACLTGTRPSPLHVVRTSQPTAHALLQLKAPAYYIVHLKQLGCETSTTVLLRANLAPDGFRPIAYLLYAVNSLLQDASMPGWHA
jgi:hypothetical protein